MVNQVPVNEIDTDLIAEKINNMMIQEMVSWMMIYMPFKSGQLLAGYINMLLDNGNIDSNPMIYADVVERMIGVNWTNPNTVEQARQRANEYAASIIVPVTQYILQSYGLL